METRRIWRAPVLSATQSASLTYRAEIVRRDPRGRSSVYYDGGELSPYGVDSLVDALRAEIHTAHDQVDVSIELKGTCSSTTVRELARRVGALSEPHLHVRISAPGYPGITIAPPSSPREKEPVSTAAASEHKS
jgi:hypothetical protein